jgi:hypothetical protein
MQAVERIRRSVRYRQLNSERSILKLGTWSRTRTMLVAFGGMESRMGVPPFEFLSIAGEMDVKRMFVRDLQQAWYHLGLPRCGSDLDELAVSLRGMLRRRRVQRLVLAGSSAGGYAAIVFGTLLGADVVLAFSPQTTLDLDVLGRMGDHRWDERLEQLTNADELNPAWIDLRSALPEARWCEETQYRLYFDEAQRADREHAERLAGLEGVRLYRFGGGGHRVARHMRDSGALARVIERAVLPGGHKQRPQGAGATPLATPTLATGELRPGSSRPNAGAD